ncbi:MAG: class B sortase [Parasporobacterium sp.]|nr:class B sortase [Parasporobacterium sp.]
MSTRSGRNESRSYYSGNSRSGDSRGNNRSGNNPSKKKKNRRSPVGKAVLSLILTLAIGVFLISGLKLISILTTYKEAEDAYKTITQTVAVMPTDSEKDYPEIDFNSLLAMNPQTKGYIFIKDVLEYPFVQGTDNETYLHTMLNGEYNPSGTLFIDCNIPEGVDAKNCIIYGHNMNDGSMFSSLYKYSDPEFYDAHRYVHIYTPEHHYLYKVVSAYTADVDGFTYTYNFPDDEAFTEFQKQTLLQSWFNSDTELTPDDKMITLSTCVNSGDEQYRNVVVLVRDSEITE